MQVLLLALIAPCAAQFGFFDQMFNGGGGARQEKQAGAQKRVNNAVENTYHQQQCDGFLCEDTLACVASANDCPCPFPDSQLKCMYPNGLGYICISKPTTEDGPDCAYVQKLLNEQY